MKDITKILSSKTAIVIYIIIAVLIVGYLVYSKYQKDAEKIKYSGLTKAEVEDGIIRIYSENYIKNIQNADPEGNIRETIEFYDTEFPKTVAENMIRAGLVQMGIDPIHYNDFSHLVGVPFLVSKYLT